MPSTPAAPARARHSTRDPAERDGLDRFPLTAFLDDDIAPGAATTTAALAAWADHRRYTAPDGKRRHLQGLFAAFSVPEASLLALPDAIQPDWQREEAPLPPAFEPPVLTAGQGLSLAWRAEEPGPFSVEEVQPGGAVALSLTNLTKLDLPPGRPPGLYRYRVRAGGAWSAPLAVTLAGGGAALFGDCHSLAAPALGGPQSAAEEAAFELLWKLLPAGDVGYALEEADDPGFTRVSSLYAGSGHDLSETDEVRFTVYGRGGGDYYFRLRVTRGEESALSPGLLVRVRPAGRRLEITPADAAAAAKTALLLHEHALRLCAARGDMVALLALPVRYREEAATRHAAALLDRFGESEPQVLTFGAIYHPWLVTREEATGALREVPPDGAACAALARTALARGAWIAAANQPIAGALALVPALQESREEELMARQINLLVKDARGFLVRSEDTLSTVPELLPLHVRRLLILLRRAALDLGATYAFEPNGAALERRVRRSFGDLLRRLYDGGAFAGASFDAAARLTVSSGEQSPRDADLGRFTVDVAVAPAGAIEVITVRLVQSGAHGRVTEGG